jgi:hypothetical protein
MSLAARIEEVLSLPSTRRIPEAARIARDSVGNTEIVAAVASILQHEPPLPPVVSNKDEDEDLEEIIPSQQRNVAKNFDRHWAGLVMASALPHPGAKQLLLDEIRYGCMRVVEMEALLTCCCCVSCCFRLNTDRRLRPSRNLLVRLSYKTRTQAMRASSICCEPRILGFAKFLSSLVLDVVEVQFSTRSPGKLAASEDWICSLALCTLARLIPFEITFG